MRTGIRAWLLVWLLAPCVLAETPDGGTESPFTFGAGARELALGGANLLDADPAFAPFWNPSRLSWAERFSVAAYHSRLFDADASYQYVGFVAPTMDFGSFGVGLFRLGVSDIEVRDVNNLLLGATEDVRLALFLAYGRRMGGFDLGLATSIEHHSLAGFATTSSPGLNLSVSKRWQPALGHIRHVGFTVQGENILQPSERLSEANVSMPYGMNAGATMGLAPWVDAPHAFSVSASLHKSEHSAMDPRLGVEYSFQKMLHLRAGWRDGHANFGAGMSFRGIAFDYALTHQDLGSIHGITLTTSFGVPVSEQRRRRIEKRETEFRDLMQKRLSQRNQAMIAGLVVEGQSAVQAGAFGSAEDYFDRALFLARAEGADTLEISERLIAVQAELNRHDLAIRFATNLDSARSTFAQRDFVGARYYAGLALGTDSTSADARRLMREATAELKASAQRERMVRQRVVVADSLLAYGRLEEAHQVLQALVEIASEDATVQSALQRVRFERWRAKASDAYGAGDNQSAVAALDSALEIFPGHAWCLALREKAESSATTPRTAAPEPASRRSRSLSNELRRQVEQIYHEGQDFFEAGHLSVALDRWEDVEHLAPDYKSVRNYLVRAYKFQGVELYGNNKLVEAIAAWKRAAVLVPGNPEIAGYIKRTEAEIRKLRELTYEQR